MPPQDEPPPRAARRLQCRSRRCRIAWATVLAFAAFFAVFDWTWLRPLIQYHVKERSGRHIDFDDLHIGLNRALQPTVRMRRLVVQNAPWADPRPLVRAAEFGFTLSWEGLRDGCLVLTRLDLVDAEVDLERQADGLRNWRLTRPDDRGPGRVRVMSIDARNTRARVVDRGIGIELELQVTPLAAAVVLPGHADLPLTKQVVLHGSRDGLAFDAQASVSDVPTFFDTGEPFALRGELRAGPSRANAQGTMTDLLQLARLDLDVRASGPRLADLGRVLGARVPLPALPAEATAHVAKQGERWQVSNLQATVGRSDLAGWARVDRREPAAGRAWLHAELTSRRVDLTDLRIADLRAAPSLPPSSRVPPPGTEATAAASLDADVDLKVGVVDGLPLGPLRGVSAHAALRGGRWAVGPAAFGVAGGRATGTLAVDTVAVPPAYALDMRLQGLQLEQLARAAPQLQRLAGALDARVAMRSRGDSLASLAGAATGTLQAELVRASIPDALDAKLGLDGGRLLRGLFGADGARTPITCSALDLRFERGRGSVRRLGFETPHVALSGAGALDLGRGTLDLVLTPHRKQAALFALDRAVRVSGPLGAPTVALIAPDGVRPGAPCVAGSAQ